MFCYIKNDQIVLIMAGYEFYGGYDKEVNRGHFY